MKCINF